MHLCLFFVHAEKYAKEHAQRVESRFSLLRIPLGAKGAAAPFGFFPPGGLARRRRCPSLADITTLGSFAAVELLCCAHYNSWQLCCRRVVVLCSSRPQARIDSNHFQGSFAALKIRRASPEARCARNHSLYFGPSRASERRTARQGRSVRRRAQRKSPQTRPTSLGSRLKRLRLAAAHSPCANGAQLARLRADMYFLRRTCRRRKWLKLYLRLRAQTLRGFFDSLKMKKRPRMGPFLHFDLSSPHALSHSMNVPVQSVAVL